MNGKFSRPLWHLVDANGLVLGRMASQITKILRGKHKPTYCPNYDCGDYVVVINASKVKLTGAKSTDKKYYWHTGYPGGLKTKTAKDYMEDRPEVIVRKAILGMLPKNTLRYYQARKLRIFPGDRHLHEDILPQGTPSIFVDKARGRADRSASSVAAESSVAEVVRQTSLSGVK